MKLTITIDLSNAAFDGPQGGDEVARILRNCAELFEGAVARSLGVFGLLDLNGNTCGQIAVTRTRRAKA